MTVRMHVRAHIILLFNSSFKLSMSMSKECILTFTITKHIVQLKSNSGDRFT